MDKISSERGMSSYVIPETEPLTREQERSLAKKIRRGDTLARNELIKRNMRLVAKAAQHFLGRGVDIDDLIGEGNLGLIKAAERFNPTSKKANGAKFSTYALWWIKQSINKHIVKNRLIRNQPSVAEHFPKASRFCNKFESKHGRTPTEYELAEGISVAVEMARKLLLPPAQVVSLDTSGDADGDCAGKGCDGLSGEIAKAGNHPAISLPIEMQEAKDWLRLAMESLENREVVVLNRRFGLGDKARPKTLEEIGDELSLTRERVRQIQNEAIGKIRYFFVDNGLDSSISSSLMEYIGVQK